MVLCPKCGGSLDPDGTCAICLLASGFEDESLMEDAGAPDVNLAGADGDSFGPYRILRVLGEGGMGMVCFADQSYPLERQVALKVIKQGLNSTAILSRFNYERHALALMDHSNIARVYDAGASKNGRPYFVMEYVNGLPITQYCDQQRLSISERL
jgi:serine/threonine-protein kinase